MFELLGGGPRRGMPSVTFDEVEVVCHDARGGAERLRWAELCEVLIVTTDQGPFVDDLFWVLRGAEADLVIPSEADGTEALLGRLQQLPGFDNDGVLLAMCSADNAQFPVWRRPGR